MLLNANSYFYKTTYKNFSTPKRPHYLSYASLQEFAKNDPFNLTILLNTDNRLYNTKEQLINKQGAVLIGVFRL